MERETPGTSPIIGLHALDHILRHLSDHLEQNPIRGDMIAEQVNINTWPYVVSAHELLELSLKALIKAHDCCYDDKRMKRDGHNLTKIFKSLESADADRQDIDHISAGYEAYASLHRDIPYRTIQDFWEGVKTDYVLWRYYPLQGWGNKTPAKASPHAMLEVTQQVTGVIARHVAKDHELKRVGERLEFSLKNRFVRHLQTIAVLSSSHGLTDRANEWVRAEDGFLNGISKTLRRLKRDGMDLNSQAIDPMILQPIESTLNDLSDPNLKFEYAGKHNMQAFSYRAVNDDTPLIWNGCRFVN